MQLINWLALQPLMADVEMLNARLREARPVREICRSLAEITLGGFPWAGRSDLIPCYHPARTYQPGQWIALPVSGNQPLRSAWQVAQVKSAESTGNSVQGRFQALVLDVDGREVPRTGGLRAATYPELDPSAFTSDELGRLADWVAENYTDPLLRTLKKLIQKGRVSGQVAGETFLPEQMFALSAERLDPFFAQLSPSLRWVSLEEILQGLPDLAELKRETALALVRSTLKVSPYRSLGGDRWTTPELFNQMDREVPYGLPGKHTHSRGLSWTRQDRKDLAPVQGKPIPAGAACALEELGIVETRSSPEPSTWQPSNGPLCLPALSTMHLTQACFPVGHALPAFAPDSRMVFLQFIDGEHQPFLLDREQGLLKAVHPEALQAEILEAGLPAGTHLWLERQGGEGYRIFTQQLASPQTVPCTRASLRNGKLHVERSQMQMMVESDDSVFQADLHPQEIQALHSAAKRDDLSVRDVLIYALQALCAADPRKVAGRTDIFNMVFLQRPCTPQSIAFLLYRLPCFEPGEGDYFRYLPHAPGMNIWKGSNRVSRLWEDLAADCVDPDPAGKRRASLAVDWELDLPSTLEPASTPEPIEMDGEVPITFSFPDGGEAVRENTLLEKVGIESIHLIQHALDVLTAPPDEGTEVNPIQDEIDMHSASQEEQDYAQAVTIPVSAGFIPYPAMIKVSTEPDPQPASAIDTRRMAYGLKIPARPLHKRPIYQRLYFCLRHMFSR